MAAATAAPVAIPRVGGAKHGLATVRVEDETSIGRSYSKKQRIIKGIGAQRRELRTRTFENPKADAPVLASLTMKAVNLRTATREEVRQYFMNTW